MNNVNFSKKYHQIHKTLNNYSGSKKCNETLHRAKTEKHECNKIVAMNVKIICCNHFTSPVLIYFHPVKDRVTLFSVSSNWWLLHVQFSLFIKRKSLPLSVCSCVAAYLYKRSHLNEKVYTYQIRHTNTSGGGRKYKINT